MKLFFGVSGYGLGYGPGFEVRISDLGLVGRWMAGCKDCAWQRVLVLTGLGYPRDLILTDQWQVNGV